MQKTLKELKPKSKKKIPQEGRRKASHITYLTNKTANLF
jgi:hypothetical protein